MLTFALERPEAAVCIPELQLTECTKLDPYLCMPTIKYHTSRLMYEGCKLYNITWGTLECRASVFWPLRWHAAVLQ